MIFVMGHLQLNQGGVDRLRSAIAPMVAGTRAEPGCCHYAIAADLLDPDRLEISERWTDQAALSGHLVSNHVVDFQFAMRRVRIINADVNIYFPDGTVNRLINV